MRDGWTETALGEVVTISRERIDPLACGPQQILRHWSIPSLDETGGPQDVPACEIGSHKFRVKNDSILFSLLNPRIPRFAFVEGGENVVCSTEFAVIQPSEGLRADYLYVLASSPVFHSKIESLTSGTTKSRERVKPSDLSEVRIFLPPNEEQRRIVDLVSSVDAYIAALEQQADTARRARNAVLSELLSAGGDDWTETSLGEVAIVNPKVGTLSEDSPFVPMDAVHVGRRFVAYYEPRGDRAGARAHGGDVLFARITPCLENGKVAQIPYGVGPCGGSTEFIVIRGTEKVTSDFLYFWASSATARTTAAGLMTGTTGRQRLSWQDLSGIELDLPPIEQQNRVVEIVSSIDNTIQSTEQAIADAKSLRSGLLSDLLSGNHEIPETYDQLLGAA